MHYPAEGDWRERAPPGSIAAMARQWHEAHTVPVTRGLHDRAIGEDHTIDEWWDPAIGDMLNWLFRTHRFHVFIVNYAWLSKAFEFCPTGVFKILDTHDRFSGRRELLGRHGIAPEFFHTTVEEERIALDRADVVWSIKPEEAAFFRSITARPVANMPHSEPLAPGLRPRIAGSVVRFGIAGAANSINERNLRAFLAAARRLHPAHPAALRVRHRRQRLRPARRRGQAMPDDGRCLLVLLRYPEHLLHLECQREPW